MTESVLPPVDVPRVEDGAIKARQGQAWAAETTHVHCYAPCSSLVARVVPAATAVAAVLLTYMLHVRKASCSLHYLRPLPFLSFARSWHGYFMCHVAPHAIRNDG